ncbi:hypothetical protein [Streptococcus equi]|uniref:hypothetical protein n=1 Tax=Streptococcus equi TaxID=1336 RepID=UPI001E4B6FFF|nr:hypothetical protein [Streptococcus equi]
MLDDPVAPGSPLLGVVSVVDEELSVAEVAAAVEVDSPVWAIAASLAVAGTWLASAPVSSAILLRSLNEVPEESSALSFLIIYFFSFSIQSLLSALF